MENVHLSINIHYNSKEGLIPVDVYETELVRTKEKYMVLNIGNMEPQSVTIFATKAQLKALAIEILKNL